MSNGNRIFGYIWIVLEIVGKLALMVLLSMWLKHTSRLEDEEKVRKFVGDNSLLE